MQIACFLVDGELFHRGDSFTAQGTHHGRSVGNP